MLKKTTLPLLLLLTWQMGNSQTKYILGVKYRFSWVYDTANRADLYTEDMVVFTDGKTTVYSSYDNLVTFPAENRRYDEIKKSGKIPIMRFTVPKTQWIIFAFPGKDTLDITQNIAEKDYVAKTYRPPITWNIQKDSAKNILGFNCRRATGTFRGRVYTAWFTSELPAPYGPWKLSGLPGMILEASDAKNEVVFSPLSVFKTTDTSVLQYPNKPQLITIKRMNEASNYYTEHPWEALKANGIELVPLNPGVSTGGSVTVTEGNNPIELTDN